MDFTFLWYFLFPICLLPVIWRFFRTPLPQQIDTKALRVPFFNQIRQELQSSDLTFALSKSAYIFWFAWIFFVLALMRPVAYREGFFLPSQARQMIMVLDVSGSMAQQDFILNNRQMTRLSAVKKLAAEFLTDRQGDAVGLTIFGTEPFIYVPLTQDVTTAKSMLNEVGIGIAGEQTAIPDALGLALKQMANVHANEKVVILFSDGATNAGFLNPQEVLDMARQMNVKIYTVGLGAEEQIIDFGFFAQKVNPSADLDEKLLQEIAAKTNGKYFRVKNTQDLKNMYDMLDKLEPVDAKAAFIRPKTELFWYPLVISMLLFCIGYVIQKRAL